jgi:hypothetical protein
VQWMLLSAPDEIRARADRILTQLVAERLDPTSTSRTLIDSSDGCPSGASAFHVAAIILGLIGVSETVSRLPSPRGRNRAATTSLAAGLLAIAAYAAYFTWAQILIAPAAVLLGLVGLTRAQDALGGRTRALAGVLIGLASLAFSAALLAYVGLTGDYPKWMPGRRTRRTPMSDAANRATSSTDQR